MFSYSLFKPKTAGGLLAVLALVLLTASAPTPAFGSSSRSEKPYEIGVLPFVDTTNSGGQGFPMALAREVAAQIAKSQGMKARVLPLGNGVSPADVTPTQAVKIGRTQGVDAVLLGTVLEASAKQSSQQSGDFSIGGFSVGGSVHSVKANVTLQGSLYDVTNGQKIDAFQAAGNISKTGVGADVGTDLGDFSTSNSFESSPIGKALIAATGNLVKHVAGDKSKMTYACVAPPGASTFGSKEKTEISMEGKIYFLPEDSEKLPDFSALKNIGSIYTAKWDIPDRDFTEGFPGVTDRFEWFAIDWQGQIYISKTGKYHFHIGDDDGAILYLDGKTVINNDDVHSWSEATGGIQLSQGNHQFRLSYFQGPAASLGLQLWVTPPGGSEKIFALQDFNREMVQDRAALGVSEDALEIRVKFGSDVLFDTDKYNLKPSANKGLDELARVIRAYPGHPVLIEGHTDSVGSAAHNRTLSENRAASVKDWLVTNGHISDACITVKGYGATMPIASNGTAEGRQKNRRVEVRIIKPAPLNTQ
ncbi:MAG: OmpA family protein [Gammaproteobacteria bacterium]